MHKHALMPKLTVINICTGKERRATRVCTTGRGGQKEIEREGVGAHLMAEGTKEFAGRQVA